MGMDTVIKTVTVNTEEFRDRVLRLRWRIQEVDNPKHVNLLNILFNISLRRGDLTNVFERDLEWLEWFEYFYRPGMQGVWFCPMCGHKMLGGEIEQLRAYPYPCCGYLNTHRCPGKVSKYVEIGSASHAFFWEKFTAGNAAYGCKNIPEYRSEPSLED
jgi:hypothetical protein